MELEELDIPEKRREVTHITITTPEGEVLNVDHLYHKPSTLPRAKFVEGAGRTGIYDENGLRRVNIGDVIIWVNKDGIALKSEIIKH